MALSCGLGAPGLAGAAAPAAATSTWSALSPPTSPPPLRNASSAYDPANGTVVLFGGVEPSGQISDATWVWNGSTWSQAPVTGSTPAAREGASMAYDAAMDPPQLILFGGQTTGGTLLSDTWSWNGSSWYQLAIPGGPAGRAGAAMAVDAAGHLVLYGGWGLPGAAAAGATTPSTAPDTSGSTTTTTAPGSTTTTTTTSPDTGTSDSTTTSTSTSTTTPTGQAGVLMPEPSTTVPSTDATASLQALVRSAPDTPRALDETWVLSQQSGGDVWSQAGTAANPPALVGASMALDAQGLTVLFGGAATQAAGATISSARNQTWLWNGSSWSQVRLRRPPMARTDAVLATDPSLGGLVLFGGIGTYGVLSDTWVFNGATWNRISPVTPPPARRSATAAIDSDTDTLLVFGGVGRRLSPLDDTVLLRAGSPTHVGGSSPTTPGGSPTSTGGSTTVPAGHGGGAGSGTTDSTGGGRVVGVAGPAQVRRGDIVTLSGSGFLPRSTVTITFHSVVTVVARTTADAHGAFLVNVTVPMGAAPGTHHFEASGEGPSGVTTLVTPVQVIGVAVRHAVSRSSVLALVAIAVAIPLLSWWALGLVLRVRRPMAGA